MRYATATRRRRELTTYLLRLREEIKNKESKTKRGRERRRGGEREYNLSVILFV